MLVELASFDQIAFGVRSLHRNRSDNGGRIQTAFRTVELLRPVQTGDVAQRMFVGEGIEWHAGSCQVMSKHLTEPAMRGVLFDDHQPASAAHTGHKLLLARW